MAVKERENESVGDHLQIQGRAEGSDVSGLVGVVDLVARIVDVRDRRTVIKGVGQAEVDGPHLAQTGLGGRQEIILPAGIVIRSDLIARVEYRPIVQEGGSTFEVQCKTLRFLAEGGAEGSGVASARYGADVQAGSHLLYDAGRGCAAHICAVHRSRREAAFQLRAVFGEPDPRGVRVQGDADLVQGAGAECGEKGIEKVST